MKSILVGLLLMSWTASSQPYTTDPSYCLPLSKARLLVADALRSKVNDSLLNISNHRVEILEDRYQSSYQSFTNLLKIEQEKLALQKEITAHTDSIVITYQEEKKTLKKQVRRLKWQRAGLAAVTVLVVGLSL